MGPVFPGGGVSGNSWIQSAFELVYITSFCILCVEGFSGCRRATSMYICLFEILKSLAT